MSDAQNLILLADSYKVSHHLQYPSGLTFLKSYFESRGGKYPQVVFFGLQYILKKYLTQSITKEMIDEAEEFCNATFQNTKIFNRAGWEYILKEHDGKIPIKIKAVPEGTIVPVKEVLFTVESTDAKVPWVTNYFETLLVQVWYPMTVCTGSYMQRRVIMDYLELTSDDPLGEIGFKLNDFGFRGSTSVESAGLGGAAHLVNFHGTDNLQALRFVRKFYGDASNKFMAGFSVPATEHSTMTVWGKDHELAAAKHMFEAFPSGVLSMVSDSYNLWNFLDQVICTDLKSKIENRDGALVVRPDSGNPVEVVVQVLDKLESYFGSSKNKKGYKILPKFLRVIQGDGIKYETLGLILGAMEKAGWSSSSVVFGSGGGLLQKVDRDTQKCAYKCCFAKIGENSVDVYKDPITDPGKTSKKGDLTLVKENGVFKTVTLDQMKPDQTEELVTVFENGKLLVSQTFKEVRGLTNNN